LGACVQGPGGDRVYTEGSGRIYGVGYDGDMLALGSDVVIVGPKWIDLAGMAAWNVSDVGYSETNGAKQWTGRIHVTQDRGCRYRQILQESNGLVSVDMSVTAEADIPTEGIYLFLGLPLEAFAGGRCEARGTNGQPVRATMPRSKPTDPRFLLVDTDHVTVTDVSRRMRVDISFDKPRGVTIQDEREWNVSRYALFTRLSQAPVLRKGETASIRFGIQLEGKADHAAVQLSMERAGGLYTLDGFGGNFVYQLSSPVTRFNLDSLRIAWGRTQMSLTDWEPENDDASPTNTQWQVLEARDVPGSTLRHEFVLAQELTKKGIPYVVSIWDLPEWMYADPGRGKDVFGRRIAPEKWDELLESIGSYLLYAKRQYSAEPDLFSFNECREGVRVQLSAEEHRDAIQRIGAHLEGLELKTKMLLADNASPGDTESYAAPTVADAEAMRHVGAVAVHSWGGATPAQYGAWSELAKKIEKPLLISELGTDALAWHTPWQFRTFHYALDELRMVQEILLHARPQGTMEWELTGDYAVADVRKEGNGSETVVPGWRYAFIKHFCNLTPLKARALGTQSSQSNVLFTAFVGKEGDAPVYTLHIANLGPSREAVLSGLPRTVLSLRMIVTTEQDMFKEMAPVPVRRGKLSVNLPAQSLLTLTTAGEAQLPDRGK